jgi:hypothetical protein
MRLSIGGEWNGPTAKHFDPVAQKGFPAAAASE